MPDDTLAFDTDRCPIDEVERIPPCDHLLTNDSIPGPPPDIPDCDDNAIDTPPAEPPCPQLNQPTVTVNYGGTPEENPPSLEFVITKGGCCDFDFDVTLNLPSITDGSCPTITMAGQAPDTMLVKPVGFAPTEANSVSDSGECNYNPDSTPGSLTLTLTKTEDCEFNIDVDMEAPCPLVSAGGLPPGCSVVKEVSFIDTEISLSASESDSIPEEKGFLTYSIQRGSNCDYELNIDLALPGRFGSKTLTIDVVTCVTIVAGSPPETPAA